MENTVLIIDFGSQYTQLIAKQVRALKIYCEIHPFQSIPKDLSKYKAAILSGSPFVVGEANAPQFDDALFRKKMPVLAIGYSADYILNSKSRGNPPTEKPETEQARLSQITTSEELFSEVVSSGEKICLTNTRTVSQLPDGYTPIAEIAPHTSAAYRIEGEDTYGLFFHPEVSETSSGKQILKNFLVRIAGLQQTWTASAFVKDTIGELRKKIGDEKVVLGLSGGVDSTVTAVLLNQAIGNHLHCIFVNHGLLRKNEFSEVLAQYKNMGLNVKGVDASDKFLDELAGVSDPETKRKIIGRLFIEVFEQEAKQLEYVRYLGQGTIYPDVIESVSYDGTVSVKSHHNVGGLPDRMNLKVVEPLRSLFKNEVRNVGSELGINPDVLGRHPFPGPGLAIRNIGEITRESLHVLKEADAVFIQTLRAWNLYNKVWQAGAILLPISSVGKKDDKRTYEKVVALRAVQSTNGMTAEWVDLPDGFLREVSNKIIHQVDGVNRVVYDISAKPPATIEWE